MGIVLRRRAAPVLGRGFRGVGWRRRGLLPTLLLLMRGQHLLLLLGLALRELLSLLAMLLLELILKRRLGLLAVLGLLLRLKLLAFGVLLGCETLLLL